MTRSKLFITSSLAAICIVFVLVGALGITWYRNHLAIGSEDSANAVGGPFHLTASNGETIDSRNLTGKPFVVLFGYTHCPDVCPTALAQISRVLTELGDRAKTLKIFFVTVDPQRDTPAVLRDYVANFDHRIIGLSGTPDQIAEVAKEYKVFYERIPDSGNDYLMNHTALIYLMDGNGELKSAVSYNDDYPTYLRKFRGFLGLDE